MVKSGPTDTRERLVDATLELVAERGFDGTSVGDIEAGAGLAPRSGALYKYFDSKLAVLEAGLQRHLDAIEDIEVDLGNAPLADVARWLLAELDRRSPGSRDGAVPVVEPRAAHVTTMVRCSNERTLTAGDGVVSGNGAPTPALPRRSSWRRRSDSTVALRIRCAPLGGGGADGSRSWRARLVYCVR